VHFGPDDVGINHIRWEVRLHWSIPADADGTAVRAISSNERSTPVNRLRPDFRTRASETITGGAAWRPVLLIAVEALMGLAAVGGGKDRVIGVGHAPTVPPRRAGERLRRTAYKTPTCPGRRWHR
jgi:hypothetical protein